MLTEAKLSANAGRIRSWAPAVIQRVAGEDEQAMLKLELVDSVEWIEGLQSSMGWQASKSRGQGYSNRQLMNAVFFRFTLGNGAKASKAFQLALAVGIPEVDLQGLAVQTRIPSKTTMSRGSVCLDMAYLLYCQDKWKQDRHLMFMWADSSPQSGRNWLMSMATTGRADKILEAASAATYLARTRSDWSDRWEALDLDLEEHARMTKILNDTLSNHTFLPVALGSGKGKVEDKSSALLQALALECSSRAELKDRLDSNVAWTTDMGPELTVPLFQTMSFEKLLPSWLHQSFQSDVGGSDAEPDAQELPEASSLMPRSLIVTIC